MHALGPCWALPVLLTLPVCEAFVVSFPVGFTEDYGLGESIASIARGLYHA